MTARQPEPQTVSTRRRSTSSTVQVRRPDPQVWKLALAQAGGDARRLEVTADGQVVVHNRQIR